MTFDAQPKVTEVSQEQMMQIMSIVPNYANKFFMSLEDNTVRITFAEENENSKIIACRSAVTLSLNGFLTLANMIGMQAAMLQKKLQEIQSLQINKVDSK